MNKFFLMTMLSLTLMACDRHDRTHHATSTETEADNEQNYDYDNTRHNVRDRDSTTQTPFDQSESELDRSATQKIRKAIMSDDSLSTNAKNIKIITVKGVVTIRGPVATSQEREAIVRKINLIEGVQRVDNQLEVVRNR